MGGLNGPTGRIPIKWHKRATKNNTYWFIFIWKCFPFMKNSQLLFCVIIIGANVSIFNRRRILRGNGRIFKWEDAQRQLGDTQRQVGGYWLASGRILRWKDTQSSHSHTNTNCDHRCVTSTLHTHTMCCDRPASDAIMKTAHYILAVNVNKQWWNG